MGQIKMSENISARIRIEHFFFKNEDCSSAHNRSSTDTINDVEGTPIRAILAIKTKYVGWKNEAMGVYKDKGAGY
jgi:hypothetical protein